MPAIRGITTRKYLMSGLIGEYHRGKNNARRINVHVLQTEWNEKPKINQKQSKKSIISSSKRKIALQPYFWVFPVKVT